MIMHPLRPELDGKNLTDNKDPDGKALFVEMVKVVKAASAGFVDYHWSKPGNDKPVPKLSYVKGFEPWGWVIGSGIYIDDVDAEFRRQVVAAEQQMSRVAETVHNASVKVQAPMRCVSSRSVRRMQPPRFPR